MTNDQPATGDDEGRMTKDEHAGGVEVAGGDVSIGGDSSSEVGNRLSKMSGS